ncbi:MAG: hypothetical protein ACE5KT_08610 [Methanosarcinales archaeon]
MAKPLEQTPELTMDEFKKFQQDLEAEQHDKKYIQEKIAILEEAKELRKIHWKYDI